MSATRFKVLKITILRNQLYKRLKEAKKNQVKYYNEKHTLRIFNVENKIY
jgi:sRNA-binding carbon storage regulator CsrA